MRHRVNEETPDRRLGRSRGGIFVAVRRSLTLQIAAAIDKPTENQKPVPGATDSLTAWSMPNFAIGMLARSTMTDSKTADLVTRRGRALSFAG